METRADHHKQPPSDDPSPGAAARRYPRWVLLENHKSCEQDPDAETLACARTYGGLPVRFSFGLAAPPAVSRLRVEVGGVVDTCPTIIAAHRDSVLVKIRTPNHDDGGYDYFIYCAGDAAADPYRPPSLSLLPPSYLTEQKEGRPENKRYMHMLDHSIALLRRGNDEVLVASLNFLAKDQKSPEPAEAELCLLRSGEMQWDLRRLPIIHDEGKLHEVSIWDTDTVVPVADRFLFWVDYYRGIIYSDVWEETPELRYVSLPVKPNPSRYHKHDGSSFRCVGATGDAVRFVEVFSRCCCGGRGTTSCARSSHAFNITTWALRMDDMATWDNVGVVDCDELWSLPGYRGVVPRIKPGYPIVSLDDPDSLCFTVRKVRYDMEDVDGDLATRLIEVDTRLVELRSVFCYNYDFRSVFVASTVSRYFDASSRSSRTLLAKIHKQAVARPIKLTLPDVAAKASPGEMLMALQEIPDLERDNMLRTYNVLLCDESQFKFKSLLVLPMDMRKDYCMLLTGN